MSSALEVEALVDGRPIRPEALDRLYQSVPFPGGHHYVLRIRKPRLDRYFPDLPQAGSVTPSADDTMILSLGLLTALREVWTRERKVEFLMNTIERVEVREGEITFSGICSPVVRETP